MQLGIYCGLGVMMPRLIEARTIISAKFVYPTLITLTVLTVDNDVILILQVYV